MLLQPFKKTIEEEKQRNQNEHKFVIINLKRQYWEGNSSDRKTHTRGFNQQNQLMYQGVGHNLQYKYHTFISFDFENVATF